MRAFLFALLSLSSAALRVTPGMSRRSAVLAGVGAVPALVLPRAAHADAIEDIAARSNAASREAAERKKREQEGFNVSEAAAGGVNAVVSLGALGFVGVIGYLATSFLGKSGQVEAYNLDGKRFLSAAEKKKLASLSASEKKKLGIKEDGTSLF